MRRLIIRPGAIGDFIVSLPALEWLRADYTEFWAPSPVLPLARFADRVRSLASTGIDLVGITEPALGAFREFDEIVSWYGTARPDFREAVAGLPFRFFPALPDGTCHAVDFYMRQVGGRDGAVPRLDVPRFKGGYIACHPFSGSAAKNWPLESYVELAQLLPLRFCVGEDRPLAGAMHIPNLHELACWLAGASLYIGNDSGITHLAAAVGVPVIALFGPTDPAIWAPRGAHVLPLSATVDRVYAEAVCVCSRTADGLS